jgi:hypothetical protein
MKRLENLSIPPHYSRQIKNLTISVFLEITVQHWRKVVQIHIFTYCCLTDKLSSFLMFSCKAIVIIHQLYSAAEYAGVSPSLPLQAGSVSYWLVRRAPSPSEWRRPTNLLTFFLHFQWFLIEICALRKNTLILKDSQVASWRIHIVRTQFLHNNCLSLWCRSGLLFA